ncbi:hypothetical protein [Granulicella aggregans]|uniref:hypothetical protein n=1 Tax=Granulicella aggregans TaxID=474949 RepID=UPI0021E041F2|nr:hypothetical protein [Granulicella aggregans]
MKKIPIFFIALVLCFAVLNAANLTPLLGPLVYTMTPLQRYYATAYLASSWHRNDPAAKTETRLLWKMKKGKSEIATEQDVVAKPVGELLGTYSPEPFLLSDKASAEGWTTVLRGPRLEFNSVKLEKFLEQEIYDGNPLWQFFVQPVLGLATLTVVGLLIRAWRRERWARGWWKQNQPQLSFWAWSLETSEGMTKRLLPRPKAPEILSAPPTRHLELQAPAPERILTASVASSETKPTPRPAAVSSAVSAPSIKKQVPAPVAPAASAKPKPAFVWDESQGID